jgi:2-polyprenyl-3-methyl-5-hydroxy-6-metoxy-1,4-benzoquinol methylase
LRYINPRPCKENISTLYADEYYNPEIDPESLLRESETINQRKLDCFTGLTAGSGRILDVGCQKGEFLAFMEQQGWVVQGVELNESAPNMFNLPVHCGTLENASLPENYFDVITYWAVIEHIPDISAEIERATNLLKPGGLLVLLTTNYNSLATGMLKLDDIPRHLVLFDKRTLCRLVENHGMRVERLFTSDSIFKASANCLLRYGLARWVSRDLDSFYRNYFKVMYEPKRALAGRLSRLRQLGFFKSSLLLADRALGMVLDRISLILDMYGVVTVVARKQQAHHSLSLAIKDR